MEKRSILDLKKYLKIDASSISLLLVNLVTIGIALWQNWSAGEIIVLYFIQSVIIGIFQVLKLLDLESFSTKGIKINEMPALPNKSTKYFFTIFFMFHYGIFHFIYLVFLIIYLSIGFVKFDLTFIFILSVVLLFSNHAVSYSLNRESDRKRNLNIGNLFFIPYARIIPMHIIIILMGFFASTGGTNTLVLLIFMTLKTIGDIISHNAEHKLYSS